MSAYLSQDELIASAAARVSTDVDYHLYSNNFSPDSYSILGDFVEAVFSGYAPITVPSGSWTAPADAGGDTVSTTSSTVLSWLKVGVTGDPQIFGYFVTRSGALAWAEEFATGPVPMDADGDTLTLFAQVQEATPLP